MAMFVKDFMHAMIKIKDDRASLILENNVIKQQL